MNKDFKLKIADLKRQNFHLFCVDPPAPAVCMDNVYKAMVRHDLSSPFCKQCFGMETERKVLAHNDLKSKPFDDFSPIYYEHPNCSVGADGFFHFLPRAIEAIDLESSDSELIMLQKPLQCALYGLPEDEQAALRQLYARAAIGWFTNLDPAPFGGNGRTKMSYSSCSPDQIELILVLNLLHLRISPDSLFVWLKELNSVTAWRFLCRIIARCHGLGFQPEFIKPEVYCAVNQVEAERLAAMAMALDRIARTDFFTSVTQSELNYAWCSIGMQDQQLYNLFENADSLYEAVRFEQSDEERLSDFETIGTILRQIVE